MTQRKLTGPAVTVYEVTYRDGSTTSVTAKSAEFGEFGVTFVGRKHQDARVFVAFVPYGDLRMVAEAQDE